MIYTLTAMLAVSVGAMFGRSTRSGAQFPCGGRDRRDRGSACHVRFGRLATSVPRHPTYSSSLIWSAFPGTQADVPPMPYLPGPVENLNP